MKKIFSLVLSLFLFVPNLHASSAGGIMVHLHNGQTVSFFFSQKPKMATSSKELSILVDDVKQVSYAYSEIERVEVSKALPTDINSQTTESLSTIFAFDNSQIKVSHLKTNTTITVFSTNGKQLYSANAGADGTLSIPTASFPKGVVIIHTQDGISYKFFNNN